jgi:translation elongation factor EF-1alpha
MKFAIVLVCLLFLVSNANSLSAIKSCVTNAFTTACKTQLYNCFNASDCSYQLHANTQHIFIKDDDIAIPKIYFSNPLAIKLH